MSQRLVFICFLSLSLCLGAGCATTSKSVEPNNAVVSASDASVAGDGDDFYAELGDDYEDDFDDDFSDEFEDYSYDDSMHISDPLEGFNRICFGFNDFFLLNIAKPVYDGYDYVMPNEFQQGVRNFFHNLLFPVRFVNALLQGEPLMAGVEFSRFVINTSLGAGGLFDVTKDKKPVVEPDIDGFGQTLGRWGVGEGWYIVWPFVGPSSARDSLGWCGDYFLDPKWVFCSTTESVVLTGYKTLNNSGSAIDAYEKFKASSIEPYIAVRNAYIQLRRENLKRVEDK